MRNMRVERIFFVVLIASTSLVLVGWLTLQRRRGKLLQSESLYSLTTPEAKIQNVTTPDSNLWRDFVSSYKFVQRLRNRFLVRVDEKSLMAVLRMSQEERNRDFRLTSGAKWMRSQSVVFAATVRNGMRGLGSTVANIHSLGKHFKDYWLVFVENDSKDGSREFLINATRQYNKMFVLGCQTVNSPLPCSLPIRYRSGKAHQPGSAYKRDRWEHADRLVVMTTLRNMYLNYVYQNLADKVDLVIVVEPDVLWENWDVGNIAQSMHYFATRPQLDTICSNTRSGSRVYDPCSLSFFDFRFGESLRRFETTDDKALVKNSDPVKVESCFQAFKVIRLTSLMRHNAFYVSAPEEWNCEHNTLLRQLPENYIDPQMKLVISKV